MSIVPDCLVLKIEEYDYLNVIDTTLYILYDQKEENYVIRGKRKNCKNNHDESSTCKTNYESCTYSFICKNKIDLQFFISFVICKSSLITFVLYNYDNLFVDSNNITYEYLKDIESSNNELAGYDNQKYNEGVLNNLLGMVKSIHNVF